MCLETNETDCLSFSDVNPREEEIVKIFYVWNCFDKTIPIIVSCVNTGLVLPIK